MSGEKIMNYIHNDSRDLRDSLFVVLSIVSVAAWILSLIEDMILAQCREEKIFLLSWIVF